MEGDDVCNKGNADSNSTLMDSEIAKSNVNSMLLSESRSGGGDMTEPAVQWDLEDLRKRAAAHIQQQAKAAIESAQHIVSSQNASLESAGGNILIDENIKSPKIDSARGIGSFDNDAESPDKDRDISIASAEQGILSSDGKMDLLLGDVRGSDPQARDALLDGILDKSDDAGKEHELHISEISGDAIMKSSQLSGQDAGETGNASQPEEPIVPMLDQLKALWVNFAWCISSA